MNSALRLNVAPVAPKHSIPTLQNRKINPALLPVSPLYYDRPLSGGRKGRCGQGPHPFIKKIGGNHFEKTNEDRNYFNESYAGAERNH